MKDDVLGSLVVIISGKSCTLFSLSNSNIKRLSGFDVDLPNQQGRGGQSQKRFERLGKEARFNYISKVIELVERTYHDNQPLYIGGPAEMKEKLADRLKIKVTKIVDLQYDKLEGLREMINRYPDLITNESMKKEKLIIDKFFTQLSINDRLVTYGEQVYQLLSDGIVSELIVHKDLLTDSIREICAKNKTELSLISSFYPEGDQIKEGFGIVGILRYELDYDLE